MLISDVEYKILLLVREAPDQKIEQEKLKDKCCHLGGDNNTIHGLVSAAYLRAAWAFTESEIPMYHLTQAGLAAIREYSDYHEKQAADRRQEDREIRAEHRAIAAEKRAGRAEILSLIATLISAASLLIALCSLLNG